MLTKVVSINSLSFIVSKANEWITKLLNYYNSQHFINKEVYCRLCNRGPCHISQGETGRCGISFEASYLRQTLLHVLIGAHTHVSSVGILLGYIAKREEIGYNLSKDDFLITMSILGKIPRKIQDLIKLYELLCKVLNEITSIIHFGQEYSPKEYLRHILITGLIDLISLELAESLNKAILKAFRKDLSGRIIKFRKPICEKPTILVIGHHSPVLHELDKVLKSNNIDVEVIGVCCMGHESSRIFNGVTFLGDLSHQVRIAKLGIADVAIVDEQCIMPFLIKSLKDVGSKIIYVSPKIRGNSPDLTSESVNDIINYLLTSDEAQILDYEKAAKVCINLAVRLHSRSRKTLENLYNDDVKYLANRCTLCELCLGKCQANIDLISIIKGIINNQVDINLLLDFWYRCTECLECEKVCPRSIPLLSIISRAYLIHKNIINTFKSGKGDIDEDEIREELPRLVLGKIPGIIILTGCSMYPNGLQDLAKIVEEYVKRGFVILTAGCTAVALSELKGIYRRGHKFSAGSIINLGSCFSNSRILSTLIKVVRQACNLEIKENFARISDYIINKIGVCCVLWGSTTSKSLATAFGMISYGIPVILSKRTYNYTPEIECNHPVIEYFDIKARRSYKYYPQPRNLIKICNSLNECMITIVKLCMRPSDSIKTRRAKLKMYIDLSLKYLNKFPCDIHRYVRCLNDIPVIYRKEILDLLDREKWSATYIPDSTLLRRE